MKSAVALLLVSAMVCSAAPDAYMPWPQPVSGPATLQGMKYYLGVPVLQQNNGGSQCDRIRKANSKQCTP